MVMRGSFTPPQLRCFRDGAELHPNAYQGTVRTRRGAVRAATDMERLGELLRSGCTLVLDAVDSVDPTMEVACRALQWWARELVQVNAYLTTQGTAGFDLHWDDHDVIVVQLAGEKEWEVRAPSRRWPMYRDAAANETPSDEVVWSGLARPGDVLHIPRGFWHRAGRQDLGDGYSLHLTFGITQRTGTDWLAWLADHSRDDDLFRRDLPWDSDEAPGAHAEQLAQAAHRLIAGYRPSEFLAAREEKQPAPRRVSTWGIFDPVTEVVCVTAFPPRVEADSRSVALRAAGKRITFAPKALPALRILLSGRPVHVEEVSATTGINVIPVVEVLLREGICAELTPGLSSAYTDLRTAGNSSNPL
jgi:hypothetical protein